MIKILFVCHGDIVHQHRVNADTYHDEEALKADSEQGF